MDFLNHLLEHFLFNLHLFGGHLTWELEYSLLRDDALYYFVHELTQWGIETFFTNGFLHLKLAGLNNSLLPPLMRN